MNNVNWLKDSYIKLLQERSEESKDIIDKLQKEIRIDESNLEKVRLNVIEIFIKMFNISDSDNPVDLREKYLGFFNKITEPWYINRKKAEEYEKVEEVIIEEIKIQEAESLKNQFINVYSQMDIN